MQPVVPGEAISSGGRVTVAACTESTHRRWRAQPCRIKPRRTSSRWPSLISGPDSPRLCVRLPAPDLRPPDEPRLLWCRSARDVGMKDLCEHLGALHECR